MVTAKQVILLLLILTCNENYAQIEYNVLPGAGPPKISIFRNYFSREKLDTVFVKKHNIRSITVMESLIIDDSLRYNKPQFIYTYAKDDKLMHSESNSWSSTGGVRRYHDYYGDSTVSVQHERRSRNDTIYRDHQFCQTTYFINDTLSRSVRSYYNFDTLTKIEDMGIYDSKALERSRRNKANKKTTSNSDMAVNISDVILSRKSLTERMCILPTGEFRFENPKPKLLKDSLDRVIEVQGSAYHQIGSKHFVAPFEHLIISYYDTTNTIETCLSYYQVDRNKFEKAAQDAPQGARPAFPHCYADSCLNFQFLASDFIVGIPQKIVVIKGSTTKQYTTTITFW